MPWEFEVITNNLLAGQGYYFNGYYSHAPPLYVFLCAAIYSLTNHSYFAVLLVQSAFSVLLSATIFAIAKMLFNDPIALIAATLVAFHPGFVYYDVFNLIPLSIDAFLISAIALSLLRFHYSPTLRKSLLIGALIGLGTLSRGIIGILLPLVLAYLVVIRTTRLRDRMIFAACMLIAGLLVVTPWMIRNYVVHKQFVMVTSTNTENFWRGNSPYATGASADEYNTKILRRTPIEF
ncbi:MAG TPA: glycosyltransferase family 39 protein [Pyrinomonadaceae bacterium]|nr:glycosyltransferase family 39 protein [Pyrinomonadaceae bacterium]